MKQTTVTLIVPNLGYNQTFDIGHAERLLRMPNNGGWVLPANSPFEFSGSTGITRKPVQSKTSAKKQEE